MKKVKKNKGISGSGICEWGGELADFETAYNYQIAYDRYFVGIYDTITDRFLYGADVASDTYDAKLGAIIAEGDHMRTSEEGVFPNEEMMKGLWTMNLDPMPIPIRISSQFIMYGHQVCKNVDGGITEVCARQQVYHKHEKYEYDIEVANLTFCLTFTEDYKLKKFLAIAPNVQWQIDVHALTYNLCPVDNCDGQGEGETVIW